MVFFYWLFNVPINYSGHYRTVGRPRHTPNGAVMRVTLVMNLGVEPRTLVLAAPNSTTEPRRFPDGSLTVVF